MKNILFVGENPFGFTGNSLMMASILDQVDSKDYNITCFVAGSEKAKTIDPFQKIPFQIIPSEDYPTNDMWGSRKLLKLISNSENLDFLIMVGLDIWRYAEIMPRIKALKSQKKFKWIWLFPYDLIQIRPDWVKMINMVDVPLVYSKYGLNLLKFSNTCPKVQYFRPPLFMKEIFRPYSQEERIAVRREIFPTVSDDTFVFGFVGVNQMRKDPQRLIKAFSVVKAHIDMPSVLYLHTELQGVFNLKQYALDCGLKSGDLLAKPQNTYYPYSSMPKVYNAIDCLVNCSMQEGLSWTVIQALACGTKCVISDSTAHKDFLSSPGCSFVPTDQLGYIPLQSEQGTTWVESNHCSFDQLMDKMEFVVNKFHKKETIVQDNFITEFLNNPSNINDVLDVIEIIPKHTKIKDKVLFAQHSSAGDILMTTRCFKGIKEKNKGKKLVYMTSSQYKDILKNNPYVDEVIDWNEQKLNEYDIVYNPRGEHILPGGFNSLDVKLSDMYPYFCGVKPDDFYIWQESILLPEKPYIVVHTTGGDAFFRCYDHMNHVIKGLDIKVVQIGSKTDMFCEGAIDFRGLNFNQTAYVMHNAEAAVVIDSFPSHLAGALGVPVVVLYGPAPSRVVGPVGDPEKIINLEPDKLKVCKKLTNCWGNARDCQTPCINTVNPMTVRKALLSLLEPKEEV